MKEPYEPEIGNGEGWWHNVQVQCVTVRSHQDAIDYIADQNQGHDLFYSVSGEANEGYVFEALDDRLVMFDGGPLSSDEPYELLYADIDWDRLYCWPANTPPVRVVFTFDPEAPALELPDAPDDGESPSPIS